MLTKGLLISLAIMLLVSAVGFVGCGEPEIVSESTIPGTYVNAENPDKSLLIRNGGTLTMEWMGISLPAEWELDGDILIIYGNTPTQHLEVRGNKLIDSNGTAWVKQ